VPLEISNFKFVVEGLTIDLILSIEVLKELTFEVKSSCSSIIGTVVSKLSLFK
jgi:hypothetical protein